MRPARRRDGADADPAARRPPRLRPSASTNSAAFAGSSRAAALGQVAIAPPTFGPNWFATVMGTGIVANAVATLPWQPPALVVASRVVWLLAALLLVVVTVSTVVHHHRQATTVRRYLDDPVLATSTERWRWRR